MTCVRVESNRRDHPRTLLQRHGRVYGNHCRKSARSPERAATPAFRRGGGGRVEGAGDARARDAIGRRGGRSRIGRRPRRTTPRAGRRRDAGSSTLTQLPGDPKVGAAGTRYTCT